MGRAGCGGCKEIAACVWRMLILDGMVMALSMSPLGLYPVAACVPTSQCFSFTRHIKTPHRDGMLSVLSRNLRTIGGWDRRRIGGVLRALPLLSSQSPSSGAIPPGEPRMGISAASILVAHLSTGSFLSLSDLHDNPGAKREVRGHAPLEGSFYRPFEWKPRLSTKQVLFVPNSPRIFYPLYLHSANAWVGALVLDPGKRQAGA